MTPKFCRKEEDQGLNLEKPTGCVFSQRQRGRRKTGRAEKTAGENRGPVGIHLQVFSIPQNGQSGIPAFVGKDWPPAFPQTHPVSGTNR